MKMLAKPCTFLPLVIKCVRYITFLHTSSLYGPSSATTSTIQDRLTNGQQPRRLYKGINSRYWHRRAVDVGRRERWKVAQYGKARPTCSSSGSQSTPHPPAAAPAAPLTSIRPSGHRLLGTFAPASGRC